MLHFGFLKNKILLLYLVKHGQYQFFITTFATELISIACVSLTIDR